MKKFTVSHFSKYKESGKKICTITVYDYTFSRFFSQFEFDVFLVGDSLGMTFKGEKNTLNVSVEEIIYHTKSVVNAQPKAFVLADMPYLSYHISKEESVKNAGRLISEGGAEGIKLEGGKEFISDIQAIVRAQIPVVGHLGLTPQSVNAFGGYKVQGKRPEKAQKIIDDAKRLQDAGVSAVVLECVPSVLGKEITETLEIPTIGIGAGVDCDGQVLVYQDLLGLNLDFIPSFVRKFGQTNKSLEESLKSYIHAVRSKDFPNQDEGF